MTTSVTIQISLSDALLWLEHRNKLLRQEQEPLRKMVARVDVQIQDALIGSVTVGKVVAPENEVLMDFLKLKT